MRRSSLPSAAPELAARLARAGYGFAVAEECAAYDECAAYARAYGDRFVDVEYERAAFDKACSDDDRRWAVNLRDRDVSVPGAAGHVDERC